MASGSAKAAWGGSPATPEVEPCPVGKGSQEFFGHRLVAVLGLEERWGCKDCPVKIQWNADMQAKWAAWVRRVMAEAAEAVGD